MEETRKTMSIPVNPQVIYKPGDSTTEITGVMIYYYSEKKIVSRRNTGLKRELTQKGYFRDKSRRAPRGNQVFILGAKAEMQVTIGDRTYTADLSDRVREYNDDAHQLSPLAFQKMAHAINKGRKKRDQCRAVVLEDELVIM